MSVVSVFVSEASIPIGEIVNAVVRNVGRATLPFQQAHSDQGSGTAFWYNDLVDATPGHENVRQYLVTAEALTRYDLAQWTLRPDLCDPEMSAELLLMGDFADGWIRLEDLGVAVMPTGALHTHADRKGWQWTTDEITDGMAAHESDLAAIGSRPAPAYVLGHDIGPQRERLQVVVAGGVLRDTAGALRWDREMPEGCVGSPVFMVVPHGSSQLKLVCIGVILPGQRGNEIVGFDRIRATVRALA